MAFRGEQADSVTSLGVAALKRSQSFVRIFQRYIIVRRRISRKAHMPVHFYDCFISLKARALELRKSLSAKRFQAVSNNASISRHSGKHGFSGFAKITKSCLKLCHLCVYHRGGIYNALRKGRN